MSVKDHRRWMYLLVTALVVVMVEGVSYIAARLLLPSGLLVTHPDISGYDEYLAYRDPVLGWPSSGTFGIGEFDHSGSRLVPAFPDTTADSCVAIFGDSFTWGDEVEPEHAYGNVLSDLLGCRVANYGVGGYGSDQAAIRYIQVVEDPAPVVILGHYSENIVRNVNQLRDLIAGGRFGFKPRFVQSPDGLATVPLPALTADEYRSVASRAAELLPYEYFIPGQSGAAGVMQLPYTKAMVNVFLHYRVTSALRGIRPTYEPFYRVDHPSGALQITAGLISRMHDVANERGQTFLLLLIPDWHELNAVRAGKSAAYAPLKDILQKQGIRIIDAADFIVAEHAQDDFCGLYFVCGSSHFNPAGYRLLAEAVYAELDVR